VRGMVLREFRGRYRGSLLGSVWSILQPMALIFIYTIVFSKVMGARIKGVEDTMAYGIFLCGGLLPWSYFTELLGRCPDIFIDQANLLKKVNFPRSTLPVVLFLSTTINFIIIFTIFLFFLLITGRFPGWSILGFIPLLLIQQSFTLGIGMSLGVFNVFFRDIGHIVKIALQFWFWVTPIVYPVSILPDRLRGLIELNPLTHFIMAYQKIVLHNQWPQLILFKYHLIVAVATLIIGFLLFRRLSGDIVDEL
jgi:lipopolysaccharide transport system permease protein